ncbi:hypothetical protein P7C73_g6854, partial [Tremellales sp. Uapishka_1]
MAADLSTLLSQPSSPPFIYLHHPHHPSSSALPAVLPSRCLVARLDAYEHYTPRLLLSGALNKLVPTEEGVEISTWDGFARRLKGIWSDLSRSTANGHGDKKSKGKVKDAFHGDETSIQIVVVVTKAERLRIVLGSGWSVITRIAEMTGVPVTVLLASSAPWDEIRPPRGDALEPIHIYLPPPTRDGKSRPGI